MPCVSRARSATRLVELASAEGARYVIPISEASLLALLPERDGSHKMRPVARTRAVRAICDKGRVLEAAPGFGIGVPRQVVLEATPGCGACPN